MNALVGIKVAEEGRKKKPCTKQVTSYCTEVIEGITVRVYDSPGLQDGTGNEESYLADIKQKIKKELDLVIFCMKMDDTRFNSGDIKTIEILTDTFGKKLWNNAVIALTYANRVDDINRKDKEAYFLEELENWREVINPFFRDSLELLHCPPLVPTGYYQQPSGLPSCENWLSLFWLDCYRVANSSGAYNLYRMNSSRIRFPGCENLALVSDEFADETESQSSPSTELTTAAPSPGGDNSKIPVIKLGEKERDSFWKKTWEMFHEHCLKAGIALGAIGIVGFGVLKFLK